MRIIKTKWRKSGAFAGAGTLVLSIALSIVLVTSPLCLAQGLWGPDGVVVSRAYDYQGFSAITTDGAGGAIVVWEDYRSGSSDIYAQRLNPSGVPMWTPDGLPVCAATGNQYWPAVTPDGHGGAYIAWQDNRAQSGWQLYEQRINAGGSLLWAQEGVPVNTSGYAVEPIITGDDAGGAIVGWRDYRDGNTYKLYAQRTDPGGNILWSAAGMPVCTVDSSVYNPQAITHGDGSFTFVWDDNRDANGSNIYAQTLNSNGAPLWIADGVPVCNAAGNQSWPNLVASNSGSSIITWQDNRDGNTEKAYLQMLNNQGVAQWPQSGGALSVANGVTADGIPVANSNGFQSSPNITTDGSGGAIACWLDGRSSPSNVYAQKFNTSGAAQWAADGVRVNTNFASDYFGLGIIPDNTGGALICWNTLSYYFIAGRQDARRLGKAPIVGINESEVRLQKLLSNGRRCPGWTDDGLATAESVVLRGEQVMTADGAGGAIVAWTQLNEAWEEGDVHAQRMATPTSVWYLAEGSQSWGFDTYITVENPNSIDVTARLTFMTPEGAATPKDVVLPAASQTTVSPRWVLDWPTDFSTKVECLEGLPIAVDRTMWWTGINAPVPEAHNSVGVNSPATTWYLPEGSSNWGFETWLLIQNPNGSEAACTLTYMIEGSNPVQVEKKVPADSRRSYNIAEDIGAKDASIMVSSDIPVIPERSMYRNSRREGHESIGTTETSTDYFLAEGTTAWGFTTYVLVQNPGANPAIVTMSFMTPGGSQTMEPFSMAPYSRKTVRLNDIIPNTDVSTQVHSDQPIIAERSMYWGEGTPLGEACHDSIGTPGSHSIFYLPDGQSSDGRETFTLVQNPNDVPVKIRITYLTPDGTGNQTLTDTLTAFSRMTFNLQDKIPSGRAAILVECLTPGRNINAERAMYWNNRGTGTDSIGGVTD